MSNAANVQFARVVGANGRVLFNGPRVRLGIHTGHAETVQLNLLTKCMNYYGA